MKTVLLIGAALAVGAASWLLPDWSARAAASPFADSTFAVVRGDLDITITENGYLKAKNSEQLKPKYGGQSTITWLIEEGSEVKKDELLVEFDATELENDLEETRTRLIQYEAELEAAQANLEIQKRDNEAELEKAELALEIARLTLKRFEEGEVKNTRREKQLALQKAKSTLSQKQKGDEEVPSLQEEGFLTAIQAERELIELQEAEINVQTAEKELELWEEYTLPMELKQKQADVRNAERSLETARERNDIRLKEKEARVSQQERHVMSARSRIKEIGKDLGNMKIHAPRPGIVIYGDPKNTWMTDQIQVGNSIWQGITVITLPDLSEMQVLIDVHEADIDLMALGQKCLVTLDTYKGKTYHGEVTDIAKVASSGRWGDSSNKQFTVEVTLDELTEELRAGITAKVDVHVETLEDVLQVPIHAVFKDGEEFLCFLPDGAGYQRRTVQIGKSNSHYVEIREGLEEGRLVLLVDPREDSVGATGGAQDAEEATPVPTPEAEA